MHLSLFSRLTIGYLAIFAIVAAASTYAIVELTDFGNQAESILRIDNRVLDHEKFLTDLLLAQSRAEQKFVITPRRGLVSAIRAFEDRFRSPCRERGGGGGRFGQTDFVTGTK